MFKKLKITSWNVNGLKSFQQPIKEILDNLNSDIICFQETKITDESLSYDTAVVKGYHSYYSMCQTKLGYSGVCIYSRDGLVPLTADIGLVSLIKHLNGALCTDISIRDRLGLSVDELAMVESEGRALWCEYTMGGEMSGRLAVVNVYCVMAEADGERRRMKTVMESMLGMVVDSISHAGADRHVIIAGDLNIKHRAEDSAEPLEPRYMLSHRLWLDSLLAPSQQCPLLAGLEHGSLIDTYRLLHPTATQTFTCWNTRIAARHANLGTRIDYILCDGALSSLLSHADILNDVLGSDHCPVSASFSSLCLLSAPVAPPLCSFNLPRFRNQSRITTFLVRTHRQDTVANKRALPDPAASGAAPPKTPRVAVNAQWAALLKGPPKPPRCSEHGFPCVRRTVAKAGQNKGKQYWSCARDASDRCGFFLWS